MPRTREAHGRFAKGSSGNPRGRPPGIPNPRRRLPDLVARPLSAAALADLLDRRPHLLRPLAAQLLPPRLAALEPAARVGIDLSQVRNAADFRRVLDKAWAALARGDLAPAEAGRIVRQARRRWRVQRQLARVRRWLTQQTGPVRPPLG